MPLFRYENVNGVDVLDVLFNDTAAEQIWMKRFPRKTPNQLHKDGFVTVGVWLPGIESKDRSKERCVSVLRLFTAPIVDGKITLDLGQVPEPGEPVTKPESLEIPPELKELTDEKLLTIAPQLGAKTSPRMPRAQLIAAIAGACKRNPKGWESVRKTLVARKLEAQGPVTGVQV